MGQRDTIRISLLYSSTGAYAALGREAIDGAMAAIAEVNSDPALPFRFEPVIADPGGSAERYAALAEEAIMRNQCRHVVGTITSWSRKEVLPIVERSGALLWYAFPHEGYEASDHALYLGACPNQHLIPLLDYVFPRFGGRPFVVGSNYIWGWEIGRIARELTDAAGGTVLSERYVPLGSVEVEHLIEEIRARKPDFVLSNLVGSSAAAFLKAYAALGRADSEFLPARRPVVSCNATETDLQDLGDAAEGHITTSIYFDRLDTPENHAFKARLADRFGARKLSSPFVSAHMAVSILANAVAEAGTDDPKAIRQLVTARRYDTPLGPLSIDPKTHHAALRSHLGRSNQAGEFEVIDSSPSPIMADPYLVHAQMQVSLAEPASSERHLPAAKSLKVIQ
ncbi:transporter substrate-binding protein [Rhizobium halophytocola]|uniref:transporter substrate-binding protein n=1 Tax=Rhizobium halophytocola TaxID=735519 RepID=UPI001AEACE66|nr:transporter substrate-binding protein [Rhizobium halophytocola]